MHTHKTCPYTYYRKATQLCCDICSLWDLYPLFRDRKDHYFHPEFEQTAGC